MEEHTSAAKDPGHLARENQFGPVERLERLSLRCCFLVRGGPGVIAQAIVSINHSDCMIGSLVLIVSFASEPASPPPRLSVWRYRLTQRRRRQESWQLEEL